MFAHELGLRERISLQDTDPQTDESLRSVNPLGKIPTLLLDDGRAVYDSRVICEYLLAQGDASRVAVPADREAWEIARDHALGDGICDAAVALRGEILRPAAEQSRRYIARQQAAVVAGCDVLAGRRRKAATPRDIARSGARMRTARCVTPSRGFPAGCPSANSR